MTSAHSRSGSPTPSRPSADLSALASQWVHRAERSARNHQQELLLLAATVLFVVVVALIGVAALSG